MLIAFYRIKKYSSQQKLLNLKVQVCDDMLLSSLRNVVCGVVGEKIAMETRANRRAFFNVVT